jgi:glutamate carboxypeptidase
MLSVNHFQNQLPAMISLIQALVEMESPSTDKAALDQLVDLLEQEGRNRAAAVKRLPQQSAGDHLRLTWGEGSGGVLLLTHIDTVHPLGSLKQMPFRHEGRKITGPGVLDMKSSVALALTVMEALNERGESLPHRVTLLCTSDEEVGSPSSKELIEATARSHQMILCLEPGLADGSVKTRRKGIGSFKLKATGIPSHAGANPGDGVNAIMEIGHQLLGLAQLDTEPRGISLNPGRIRGGSRINVVPEHCSVDIDVRIPSEAAGHWIEAEFDNLKPQLPGAKVDVSGGWNRPPMPRTSAIAEAFRLAQTVASEIGLELGEGQSGGGSDANFVAPLGLPLLDGLGPLGAGAHSNDEYVWVESLPQRAALLAGLVRHPLPD